MPNPVKREYTIRSIPIQTFRNGALVLKKDFRRKQRRGGKLDPKWVGPFKVVCHGLFCLQDISNRNNIVARVNGSHLKEYKSTSKIIVIKRFSILCMYCV